MAEMRLLLVVALSTLFSLHVAEENVARIFDSFDTSIEVFPWLASVRATPTIPLCSAVIIDDRYALTAASCVKPFEFFWSFLSLKAASNDFRAVNDSTDQIRLIAQVIVHPNYTAAQPDRNNLVLLRVESPWNFSSASVSSIALSNLTSLEDMNLTTVGWGIALQQNSSMPSAPLQQVNLLENVACSRNRTVDPSTQLCASGRRCGTSSFVDKTLRLFF